MEQQQQSRFDGWAIVDVLGHQRYFGHVTTEYFGTTAFFRVETPAREQREEVLAQEGYVSNNYGFCQAGTRVIRTAKPGAVRLIGAGSIYMLTPSTQAEVLTQLDDADPCGVLSVTAPDGIPVELSEQPW